MYINNSYHEKQNDRISGKWLRNNQLVRDCITANKNCSFILCVAISEKITVTMHFDAINSNQSVVGVAKSNLYKSVKRSVQTDTRDKTLLTAWPMRYH